MPQWRPTSLCILVVSVLLFLFFFNSGAFIFGPSALSIPFNPSNGSVTLRIKNLAFSNFPAFIESHPPQNSKVTLTSFCGSEVAIRGRSVSLLRNNYLGLFELCEDLSITAAPIIYGSGLWLTVRHSTATKLIWIGRYVMLFFVGAAFMFLFKNGKHFSVLRSVLVTQSCCFFMLDPLFLVFDIFRSIGVVHWGVFALFWWRAASEVFLQYCPLIRQSGAFYRGVMGAPGIALLLATAWRSSFLGKVALAAGMVPVALAVAFLVQAGHTQGRVALTVHIVGGTVAMVLVYLVNVVGIVFVSLRDEFVCQTIEFSVLGCYPLFQMIFQMGERNDEAEEHISNPKKYEKIEEMLEALTRFDEEIRFEVTESPDGGGQQ
jgi:hypothetical protein